MRKAIIFLFSGQGSHYYQMGKELFDEEKTFKKWMLIGNELIYEKIRIDLIKELYDKDHRISDLFNQTLLTHPAIFLFEYALSQVLLKRGVVPDYVLGTSLGELVAASIAGVMSFEEALLAVLKQAEALEKYCQKGGMLAILHSVSVFQEEIKAFAELVGVNFDAHFIVSGFTENLKIVEERLQKQAILAQLLAVSHAFHSSTIEPAREIYLASIKNVCFKKASIAWISGCRGEILSTIELKYLWEIIRLPILFQQIIQQLESNGNYIYLDLGPSGTLANFVKYNLPLHSSSQILPVCTPFRSQLHKLELIKGTI